MPILSPVLSNIDVLECHPKESHHKPNQERHLWHKFKWANPILCFVITGILSSSMLTAHATPSSVMPSLANHNHELDLTNLPDLGSDGTRFVDSTEHKSVGQWSLQQLNGHTKRLDDAWSQQALENMAWDINAHAGLPAPLALVLINNSQINAFAIPGGVMGINAGTVIEAHSMDEVASVIAHEVAHLSQRHYESRQDAGRKALMLQIGGLLAAIAASSAGGEGSNAAAAMMVGSQTLAQESQMAFSRSNEREADRVGMALMTKAGYDPAAMPRFFATLNAQSQLNQSRNQFLPSFIMTHPLSAERLSEAQTRANAYQAQQAGGSTYPTSSEQAQTFALLNWRLKVLTEQATENELKAVTYSSDKHNRQGAKLALAYWYGQANRFSEANALLHELRQNGSSPQALEPLLSITQAQILGMQNQWSDAVEQLESWQRIYPERRDLRVELANAYLGLSKTKGDKALIQQASRQAIALLKPLLTDRPQDVLTLGLLESAYAELAKASAQSTQQTNNSTPVSTPIDVATVQSLRYRSLKQLWQGRYDDALVSINLAINTADPKAKNDANGEKTNTASLKPAQTKSIDTNANMAPLLAVLKQDLQDIKKAKDFKP